MSNDLLYTVPEAAELLKAGLLTPLKLGRYKVPRSELITFVERYKGKDLTDLNNIKDIEF